LQHNPQIYNFQINYQSSKAQKCLKNLTYKNIFKEKRLRTLIFLPKALNLMTASWIDLVTNIISQLRLYHNFKTLLLPSRR